MWLGASIYSAITIYEFEYKQANLNIASSVWRVV